MAEPDGCAGLGRGSTTLFRVGAIAALVTVVITIVQVVVFVVWPPPSFQPTPAAVTEVFVLLHASPALGLVELDALMNIDYVLLILVYLALYAALSRASPALMTTGTVLALIAIAIYFTVNPALSMLSLGDQYAAAVTDAHRAGLVSAGLAVLANFQGTAFVVHYVMMGVAGLLVSTAMLRSQTFSRATAIAGLLQGAMMLIPSTFGMIGLVFAVGSLVPFSIWFLLIARRLLGMASVKAARQQ